MSDNKQYLHDCNYLFLSITLSGDLNVMSIYFYKSLETKLQYFIEVLGPLRTKTPYIKHENVRLMTIVEVTTMP